MKNLFKSKKILFLIIALILLCVILIKMEFFVGRGGSTDLGDDVVKVEAIDYNSENNSLAKEVRYLDQRTYNIPLYLLFSVKSKGSDKLLINRMSEFGFIPPLNRKKEISEESLDSDKDAILPIGFGINHSVKLLNSPIVTMNCAACHTGALRVDGQLYVFDGSNNLVNTSEWAKHVNDSIMATIENKSELLKMIVRWRKIKPLPEELDPQVSSEFLEQLGNKMSEISAKESVSVSRLKNIPRPVARVVPSSENKDHQYILAQTILESLERDIETEEEIEKTYKKFLGDDVIPVPPAAVRLPNKSNGPSAERTRPPTEVAKSNSFEETGSLLTNIITKVRKLTLLLRELHALRKHVMDVAAETGNHGPARDDVWYTVGRLLADFSKDDINPGAPVRVPNLYSFAFYNKQLGSGYEPHRKYMFHYDGNTDSIEERNLTQGFTLGAISPGEKSTVKGIQSIKEMYVSLESLLKAEKSYMKITIPNFDKKFSKYLDKDLAKKGHKIFHEKRLNPSHNAVKHSCADCHSTPEGRRVPLSIVGTDPTRANIFAGEREIHFDKLVSEIRSKIDAVNRTLGTDVAKGSWKGVNNSYMARPLNGIWASPPYLHNGSVRTLWQLLTPPAEREKSFYTGTRNFDPVDVGYKNEEFYTPLGSDKEVKSYLQQNFNEKAGKRQYTNQGHTFGTEYTTEEKRALIEYIKTLGEPE